MKRYLSIAILAALLTACGGGSSGNGSSANGGNENGSPVLFADTFANAVATLAAMMSDDASPVSTDSYAATSPEDTLPGQVQQ